MSMLRVGLSSISRKSASSSDMKKSIVLFPGHFSPIHIVHLMIALSSYNLLNAEKVLFLPVKEDSYASFEDRTKMIRLAFHDYGLESDSFSVSNACLRLPAFSDVVSYYKRANPESRIYVLLGEDEFPHLLKEKNFDKIAYLSTFVLVKRNAPLPKEIENRFLIRYLNLFPFSISSSMIRSGQQLYTTKNVLRYIGEHRLYFTKEIASLMKESRYNHSLSVALTAYEIAKHNPSKGIEPEIAFQAGIFHDCGKDLPLEEQKKIVETHFKEFVPCPEFALHQFVGSYLAKEKFHIENEDVLSAIRFHCTGKKEMDDLEKLVYAADKCEPKRVFPTKKNRHAMYKDLESGFVHLLQDQKEYFTKNNIEFMNTALSRDMYEEYVKGDKNA